MSNTNPDSLHDILIKYRLDIKNIKPAEAYLKAKSAINEYALSVGLKCVGEDEVGLISDMGDEVIHDQTPEEVIGNKIRTEIREALKKRFKGEK